MCINDIYIWYIYDIYISFIHIFNLCDGIRKRLHRLFAEFGFKLDIQTDLKIADYLDVTLNLYNGTVSPFRKKKN